MILLAATLAHAGLRADLDREARDAPQIAVACSSARATLARFDELANALSEGGPLPPEVGETLANLDALLGPDARLTAAWWKEGSTLRLGFDTSLDAAALAAEVAKLDPTAPGRAELGPEGWAVYEGSGNVLRVSVREGWATLADGAPPPGERSLPASFLGALPDAGGCTFALAIPDDDLGQMDVAFHLPDERGKPASFALAVPALQDSPAVLLQGAVPPPVATPVAPEALLVLGIGLDSIDFSVFLEGKELRQARQLQNFFPVTGGTMLAVLQTEPAPKVAAALPFAGRMPAPRVARRTLRLLRKLEIPAQRLDATHFVVRLDALELLAAAQDNLLYLSTDPGTLNAMERGLGTPWVTGEVATVAAEWPLLLTSRVLPRSGGAPSAELPRPLLLAVDVEGGVVRGLVDLPLTPAQLREVVQAIEAARAATRAEAGPTVE